MMAAVLCSAFFACNVAYADEMPKWQVSDRPAPVFYQRDVSALEIEPVTQCENMPESQYEPIWDVEAQFSEYEPMFEPVGLYEPSDGLTMEGGINYHDGRLETYYSSNVAQHYRQGEWTTDGEGFWRTSDGYYVVAASDMEQGTVFEGSKGECIVLDSGCANGTTDYYVNWN